LEIWTFATQALSKPRVQRISTLAFDEIPMFLTQGGRGLGLDGPWRLPLQGTSSPRFSAEYPEASGNSDQAKAAKMK